MTDRGGRAPDLPRLVVGNLSAGYRRDEPAITEVSFELGAKTILAVLGPNGGGKTTLFKALLDQLPHRLGHVEIDGRAAYVPQTERTRLDFPVSALDVALMGSYGGLPWYRRVGPAEREAARAALDRVGLADAAATGFGALSGGQRQRVLIARALTQGSQVVLLDEPLSGIDRASAERVLAVLGELRDAGATLLVATHDIEQARSFDSVLCLNRRQVAFGPPDATLTADVLAETYGAELVILDGGNRAIAVQHHEH